MNSLCEKCHLKYRCALNYDGKPCKENRDVEPTYMDRFKDRVNSCVKPEELANYLVDFLIGSHIISSDDEEYVEEEFTNLFNKDAL